MYAASSAAHCFSSQVGSGSLLLVWQGCNERRDLIDVHRLKHVERTAVRRRTKHRIIGAVGGCTHASDLVDEIFVEVGRADACRCCLRLTTHQLV